MSGPLHVPGFPTLGICIQAVSVRACGVTWLPAAHLKRPRFLPVFYFKHSDCFLLPHTRDTCIHIYIACETKMVICVLFQAVIFIQGSESKGDSLCLLPVYPVFDNLAGQTALLITRCGLPLAGTTPTCTGHGSLCQDTLTQKDLWSVPRNRLVDYCVF